MLSGVYSQPDGSVQLYYSDGLLGLSVFERAGDLDWDALPSGGRTTEIGDLRTRVYRTAAGTAVVWGKDGVTYTCVTDAPLDEIAAVTPDLTPSDSGAFADVGRFLTAPFAGGSPPRLPGASGWRSTFGGRTAEGRPARRGLEIDLRGS